MALTKEQWKEIEEQLSSSYGRVELRCDGYEITADMQKLKNLRYCIAVYVDGVIKGEWMKGEHVIPLKFHREKKIFLYPEKMRSDAEKKLANRRLDKVLRGFYEERLRHISFWDPYWTSPSAFCRHIRKTCQSIEIVKVGYGA